MAAFSGEEYRYDRDARMAPGLTDNSVHGTRARVSVSVYCRLSFSCRSQRKRREARVIARVESNLWERRPGVLSGDALGFGSPEQRFV